MWLHFQLYWSFEHVILAQGQKLGGGLNFPDVSSVILMSEPLAKAPRAGTHPWSCGDPAGPPRLQASNTAALLLALGLTMNDLGLL